MIHTFLVVNDNFECLIFQVIETLPLEIKTFVNPSTFTTL
jgi:hypothetical protein